MLEALAAIPNLASAININGGEGECVRIKLDIYLRDESDITKLMDLRGTELAITLKET